MPAERAELEFGAPTSWKLSDAFEVEASLRRPREESRRMSTTMTPERRIPIRREPVALVPAERAELEFGAPTSWKLSDAFEVEASLRRLLQGAVGAV
jgi:hypothetical protein